jgi:hypothetical protein
MIKRFPTDYVSTIGKSRNIYMSTVVPYGVHSKAGVQSVWTPPETGPRTAAVDL